jgi:hypothetical protein
MPHHQRRLPRSGPCGIIDQIARGLEPVSADHVEQRNQVRQGEGAPMPDDRTLPATLRSAESEWVIWTLFIKGFRRGKGWKRQQPHKRRRDAHA